MEQTANNLAWGGQFKKFKIPSVQSLGGTETNISVYLPPAASEGKKVPVLYYLAGECAGFQPYHFMLRNVIALLGLKDMATLVQN